MESRGNASRVNESRGESVECKGERQWAGDGEWVGDEVVGGSFVSSDTWRMFLPGMFGGLYAVCSQSGGKR